MNGKLSEEGRRRLLGTTGIRAVPSSYLKKERARKK
jgi:hypothetical protein